MMKRKQSFSLIEMILAVAVFGIVLLLIYSIYNMGASISNQSLWEASVSEELKREYSILAKDFKEVRLIDQSHIGNNSLLLNFEGQNNETDVVLYEYIPENKTLYRNGEEFIQHLNQFQFSAEQYNNYGYLVLMKINMEFKINEEYEIPPFEFYLRKRY